MTGTRRRRRLSATARPVARATSPGGPTGHSTAAARMTPIRGRPEPATDHEQQRRQPEHHPATVAAPREPNCPHRQRDGDDDREAPAFSRLGTTVNAGSPLRTANASESGHDSMTSPFECRGPCRISPIPCSTPARPASTPNTATVAVVARRCAGRDRSALVRIVVRCDGDSIRRHPSSGAGSSAGAVRCASKNAVIRWRASSADGSW